MLVDIKIKNEKDIKPNSILISKDGKVFEIVDKLELTKELISEISTLRKEMLNLTKSNDKRITALEEKMTKFIKAFMKGSE